jgi:hypothetical protein
MEKVSKGESPWTVIGSEDERIKAALEFKDKVGKIMNFMSAATDSPEAMEERLKECGAPVPDAMSRGAEEYVKNLAAAKEQLPEVQKLINDIRSKDDECLQKQVDAYTACVQDAECHSVSASKCDSLTPPGDWAPPR